VLPERKLEMFEIRHISNIFFLQIMLSRSSEAITERRTVKVQFRFIYLNMCSVITHLL